MEKIDIHKLNVNPDNPRTASEFMEGKLIESILVFPKMLDVRPIIINKDNLVLGGNQRTSMLLRIIDMDDDEIQEYLFNQKKYRLMSDCDKNKLLNYWADFRNNPIVSVRVVNLSKEEEKELLVKDNLHYGEDDIDILKKNFDRDAIGDYLGSVPWNLYDYNDKINDSAIKQERTWSSQQFKCGYISLIMTDEEFVWLNKELDKYLAKNNGTSDGFLNYILHYEEKSE